LPDALVVSTLERKEFLAEQGIDAAFAPLGYHPSLGRDLGLERDIDVLFLGSLDVPRRKRILRSLRSAGLNVLALGSWSDPAFWGEERVRLLNRTKVLLNLPRHPGLLSGYRMVIGMANRALVVAEPIYQPAPYRPGVHFVSASPGEIPEVVNDLLEDDEQRRAIADAAYEFVTTELTLERSVRTMLALAEAGA
jgi:glycosyltransferase involved in cell wall biosynthesis